ncbi:hypothetical protein [Helicobacter ibis]|uniref:Cell division protein ZapB n=1 Tax=Helicobacter ibis TaxID=2962633 RepID=A0ABT4VFN4_9HELI|nr:hypothetical protein [Helicobacter ibis]MDA3969526.1 hypothetical protein [Helicobacter ibis]
MEENESNTLLEGIDKLLEEYKLFKEENQQLRQQIVLLKAENEAKKSEINSLCDEINEKDRILETQNKELAVIKDKIQSVIKG